MRFANLFKNKYILLATFFLLSGVVYLFLEHLKERDIESFKRENYRLSVLEAKIYLSTLIKEKQNATAAIGLGFAKNKEVLEALKGKKSTANLLNEYSKRLAENTDFKNVWFQLLSKEGVSLERSWTPITNDPLVKLRKDLQQAINEKQIINSISIGKFDMTFKSIIPIHSATNEHLGFLEVITHFNSISEKLKEKKINGVILADKIYKSQLSHPFTNIFIQDYYVANENVDKKLVAYLTQQNIQKYIERLEMEEYFVDENLKNIVSYYRLNDIENTKNLGHIILMQDVNSLDMSNIVYINYIYNIYLFFAIIVLLLIFYFSATIEIKNLSGKRYSGEILGYIFIVYSVLGFGIYKLLDAKYEGDIEGYKQNITTQTLLEYNSIVEKNRDIADFVYSEIVSQKDIKMLFEQRDREGLYQAMSKTYRQLTKKYNIRQVHFHLPDATSFLRMHKKNLYGDSLANIRESVVFVNKTLTPFYGFEEGRVYNGYRYVYPILNENGKHLGSIEISFDIKSFIDNYMKFFEAKRASFLISEKVMEEKVFEKEQSNYVKSPIPGFLFDKLILEGLDKKRNDSIAQTVLQDFEDIASKIKKGNPFTVHLTQKDEIIIVVPIINKLSGDVVASINVAKDDRFIRYRQNEFFQLIVVVLIVLAFILFFIYREFLSKKRAQMELENNQKILDSQNSFIIITDGFEIKRVNQTFLDFFQYPTLEKFKEEHSCICDFFVYEKGKNYITKEIENMNWFEYIKIPEHTQRQVKIIDKENDEHIFYIEINFYNNLKDGNYILTFIDITHLKNIENQLFYSEKMASLGNMIGNIAHQWRQPLSVISTCASGIAMKHEYGILKDEEIEANMEIIVQNSQYLSDTIDTFRDFIKESGDKEQTKVSLNDAIVATLAIMDASLKNNFINLFYTPPPKEYYKVMAKGEFSQILTNLINNAKDILMETSF